MNASGCCTCIFPGSASDCERLTARLDLIVESHECLLPGITRTLVERVQSSHHITLVHDNGQLQVYNTPMVQPAWHTWTS